MMQLTLFIVFVYRTWELRFLDMFVLTNSCRRFAFETESDMIRVGRGSILEHNFTLNHRTGKVLQILQLVKTSISEKRKKILIIQFALQLHFHHSIFFASQKGLTYQRQYLIPQLIHEHQNKP